MPHRFWPLNPSPLSVVFGRTLVQWSVTRRDGALATRVLLISFVTLAKLAA
jgi:hypothetical protein